MTAPTTKLPRHQWRLMNTLYDQMALRMTRKASLILHWSDASVDDLAALERPGLLRGASLRGRLPVSLIDPDMPMDTVELTLTPRGIAWYHGNPYNAAVLAANYHGAKHPRPLCRIAAFLDVDLTALAAVIDDGLVTATPDGPDPAPRVTVAALRDANTAWRISTTPAGLYVLAA